MFSLFDTNAILKRSALPHRYLLAFALFVLAFGLRYLLRPVQGGLPFVTFYPAILISFYLFGLGAGALVAVLSGLAGQYFFIATYSGSSTGLKDYTALSFFCLTSFLIGHFITKLRYNQTRYLALVNQAAADALFIHDQNGKLIEVNRKACESTGYTKDELLSMNMLDLETDFEVQSGKAAWAKIVPGTTSTLFGHHRRKDGSTFPVEVRFGLMMFDDQPLYIGFVRDICERMQAQEVLEESERNFRSLFEFSPTGMIAIDAETDLIVESNVVAQNMFGYSKEELLSKTTADLTHPDDIVISKNTGRRLVYGIDDHIHLKKRYLRKNGDVFWAELDISAEKHGGIVVRFICSFVDITERKKLEMELERQAHIDYLTGVSNRGYFMEQAERELSRAIRYDNTLSLLMLDIDFFKQVNDSYGHKTGDAVLKIMAEECRNTLRDVDIIGRIGGEEFAILLPETDKDKAIEVSERLRAALECAKVPLASGEPVLFTVSIGVASLMAKDDNIEVLLNLADKALYEAKKNGRNKVCVAMQ